MPPPTCRTSPTRLPPRRSPRSSRDTRLGAPDMLTGEQYLASLDDDRATYFEGRRIKDLLVEPAFATPARSIAAGYDRCYSPEPGATNPLVLAPRSPEELRERAGVIGEMDLALNSRTSR